MKQEIKKLNRSWTRTVAFKELGYETDLWKTDWTKHKHLLVKWLSSKHILTKTFAKKLHKDSLKQIYEHINNGWRYNNTASIKEGGGGNGWSPNYYRTLKFPLIQEDDDTYGWIYEKQKKILKLKLS